MTNEISSRRLNEISAEFVTEVAQGLEEPADIAFRYGFTRSEFKVLQKHKPFAAAVERKRIELEKDGYTAKTKAVLMTDPLMDKIFKMAMADGATFGQVMDAFKAMTRLGDLEPRGVTAQAATGPAFSINISIPQYTPPAEKVITPIKDILNLPTFDEKIQDIQTVAVRGSDAVDGEG